jgi:glyoxylase-like metal-dependent hydrolase (beta-lactamase superfamily II)
MPRRILRYMIVGETTQHPRGSAMLSWKIGDVTIRKLVEVEAAMPSGEPGSMLPEGVPDAIKRIGWLVPHYATPEGHLKLSVHALLVEAPALRLVVDTCIGNDKPRAGTMFDRLQTRFLHDLVAAGWTRDSVDAVLCTHLHLDHVGWNTVMEEGRWIPTFPRARYYIGREELEAAERYAASAGARPIDQAILADSVRPVLDAGLATLVDTDARLSPEIRLMPTPGHTPGHVSVIIESQGVRAAITGDIMHHLCQMARPEWSSSFDADQDQARVTRRRFLAGFADTPTLVIGTHFASPTAGRVVRDGAAYRFVV